MKKKHLLIALAAFATVSVKLSNQTWDTNYVYVGSTSSVTY